MATLQETVNQATASFTGPVGQSMVPTPVQGPVKPSEPAMISSSQGEAVVNRATDTLNTLKGVGVEPEPVETAPKAPEPVTTEPSKDSVTLINPETGQEKTLRGDAINEMAMNALKEQGYQESTADVSTPTKSPEVTAAETAMKNAETSLNEAMSQLESSTITDKELRAQTREIKRMYSARMKKMEETNRRRQQTMNTLGIRLGSRYTGGSAGTFGSILAEEERQGIERINDIESQMRKAITDAEKAAKDHNYGVYVKQVELAKTKYDEKVKAFADLQAAQKKADEELAEETETVANQADVIEQISAGTTDPIEIFTALGGKVPFDVIKELTDTLPGTGEAFTLGRYDIRYDAEGNVLARGASAGGGGVVGEEGAVGGSLGGIIPVGTPTVAGLGSSYEKSGFEAQMLIDDIMNKIPAQLRNSEKETAEKKEQIRKQLAAGYSYQDIVDRLSGFSLQGGGDRALGSALYNASLGTDLDVGQLASLINRGANKEAVAVVENKKLADVKMFFANPDEASSYVNATNQALALLEDADFPTEFLGTFDGRKFKAERFFGADATDEQRRKLQQLETQLAIINAPLRVSIAGTAATPSEMDKIGGIQTDILDNPGTMKTKLKQMQDSILTFHNSARSQRGLPTVNTKQLVDPNARVELYRSIPAQEKAQSYSTASNADLLGTGSSQTSDPNGIY